MVAAISIALLAVLWNTLLAGTTSATKCNGGDKAAQRAAKTCRELHAALPDIITLPAETQEYDDLRDNNWSHTVWQRPACIASPARTADVSVLVKKLVRANVPFAIRSGGHSPNRGDASIGADGVLLSLHELDRVAYDAAGGLVSIGPGARWGAVYEELDKYNKTAVGGRVLDVGVGGLSLGGGLSYLSDLYGFVCDNVVNYEVVLANGQVVEATADSPHSDLFWALKGGSNNFGIVTRFQSQTYPSPLAWGGIQVFSADQTPALLQALHTYQTTPNKDPHANLIINLIPTNNTLLLTLVYLRPVPHPAVFAPFYALTPLVEQTAVMSLHALMAQFPPATQPRWTWYVNSFRPDAALYAAISALLAPESPEVAAIAKLQAGSLVAAVQPVGVSAVLAGGDRGHHQHHHNKPGDTWGGKGTGNAMGLERVNQTWFSVSAAWWNEGDDGAVDAAVRSLHDKIRKLAERAGAQLEYVFMNDANAKQDVIAGYGHENVRRLWQVARRYDERGVFQSLVPGGRKLPRVGH
ncbi:hypothetical protein C8A00DRAFT_14368 [Chaetomidium leptoderma]|uniref:FAD-binding PCMH-type domain-containing protein n=1 Tax=Chaetomidium leptoderma TaxID=669021 RepID=A0AAN6VNN4_9PEZI|nr:hypothetical protein C8A00DRAFT_14368 [Chaetomidium leptoderma]